MRWIPLLLALAVSLGCGAKDTEYGGGGGGGSGVSSSARTKAVSPATIRADPIANLLSAKGQAAGLVRFQGAPQPGGTIVFIPADKRGASVTALITADGTYTVSGLPVGAYTVTITSDDGPATKSSKSGAVPSRRKPLPAEYGDPATSPLSCTVQSGANELNFDLK